MPSTGATSISPAFGAGWGTTTNADRLKMVRTRISSAMTTKNGAGNAAIDKQLLRQYILEEALAAQTISGSIKGVMRCVSTNLGVGFLAVRVAICASDGTNVRELLSIQSSTNTGAQPPGFAVSLTNRRLEQGNDDFALDLTSTASNAGDFLIVELGYDDPSSNTGRFGSISFGDDSASDLPEDESTTTADNPWVEFTHNFTFDTGASGQPYAKRTGGIPFMSRNRGVW